MIAARRYRECTRPHSTNLPGWFKEPDIGAKDGLAWLPADIPLGPRTGERVKSVSFLVLDVEAKAEKDKDENGDPVKDKHGDTTKRVIGPEPPTPDEMLTELFLCTHDLFPPNRLLSIAIAAPSWTV